MGSRGMEKGCDGFALLVILEDDGNPIDVRTLSHQLYTSADIAS